MSVYRVSIVNTILNFRRILRIEAYSRIEAGTAARQQLGRYGYDELESVVCIPDWQMKGVQ